MCLYFSLKRLPKTSIIIRYSLTWRHCKKGNICVPITLFKINISSQLPLKSCYSGMFSKNNCPQKPTSRRILQYRCSELVAKLFEKYLQGSGICCKFACKTFLLLTTYAEELYFTRHFAEQLFQSKTKHPVHIEE